jgi:hypothetical protein
VIPRSWSSWSLIVPHRVGRGLKRTEAVTAGSPRTSPETPRFPAADPSPSSRREPEKG